LFENRYTDSTGAAEKQAIIKTSALFYSRPFLYRTLY